MHNKHNSILSSASGSEECVSGLTILLHAYVYARDANRNLLDFAVEIDELRRVGLSNSYFRWLTCKGYVQHGRDLTKDGEIHREISIENNLVFSENSCFVLTPKGVRYARDVSSTPADLSEMRIPSSTQQIPTWDAERRQLLYAGRLIKEFRSNSPNQESVLVAFQEEGWPPRIYDPLPPQPDLEPKERLRNTIKSLNRKQKTRLIRFMGDGTGEAILWDLLAGTRHVSS